VTRVYWFRCNFAHGNCFIRSVVIASVIPLQNAPSMSHIRTWYISCQIARMLTACWLVAKGSYFFNSLLDLLFVFYVVVCFKQNWTRRKRKTTAHECDYDSLRRNLEMAVNMTFLFWKHSYRSFLRYFIDLLRNGF
jgi:hypothetical protein